MRMGIGLQNVIELLNRMRGGPGSPCRRSRVPRTGLAFVHGLRSELVTLQRTATVYDLSLITPEDFESLRGKQLPLADSEHSLQIDSIERLRSPSPRPAPFAVTLLAPEGLRGEQGIYTLIHPALGELALFLVPIEPREGRSRFELVFN